MKQRVGKRKSPRKCADKRSRPLLQAFQQDQVAIVAVTCKRVVSALSREKHLDMVSRQFRNVIQRNRGRLTDGLFHVPHVFRDKGRKILGRDGHIVMLGAVPLGSQFCVGPLVGNFATGKSYRETTDLFIWPVYGEAHYSGSIHPPAQKD